MFFVCSLGVAYAQTSTKPVVLYQWTDTAGAVHYAENLDDVPVAFRQNAIKGTFTPAQAGITPNPGAKPTGQIDMIEDSYYREDNFYHIKGRIRNGFNQQVTQVKVKVTFFDEEDRFLMVETTLVDPLVLAPGQEGQFHLMVKVNPRIDSYKIEAIGRP